MDEEQQKWYKQYLSSFGVKEVLRAGCAILAWQFLGVALALIIAIPGKNEIFAQVIFGIFTLSIFVFPFLIRWRPAYSLLRAIIGNENLPTEPMPRSTTKLPHQPKPWWAYLPGIWGWLMLLLLLYVIIQYFSK